MMEFGLFSVFLGLVVLASFIWLLIVVFRESLLWGFLVFFLSPFSAIAFAVYHWDEAKKPFLVYLAAMLGFSVMLFSAFTKVGGLETIEITHKAIKQLDEGEITEVEAANRVANQMQSNIKRMEEVGVIGADERKLLEEKVQKLKLDDSASGSTKAPATASAAASKTNVAQPATETLKAKTANVDKSGTVATQPQPEEGGPAQQKATQQKLEYGPGWSLEGAAEMKRKEYKAKQLELPSPKVEGHYVAVPVSRAEEYIGRQVRVVREKTRNDGLLKAANKNYLILDMQVSGGQVDYEIKRTQVYSLYVLTVSSGEKALSQ